MATEVQSAMVESLKRVFALAVDGSIDTSSQLYPAMATYYVEKCRRVESELVHASTSRGGYWPTNWQHRAGRIVFT